MSRSAASPRVFQQLYSPRCPSPLGLPPFTPHIAFQETPASAPAERHYIQRSAEPTGHLRYPTEPRRPPGLTGGSTKRCRAPPPAPLNLDSEHHPAASVQLPSAPATDGGGNNNAQTTQQLGREEIPAPQKSPTPSSSSSLSLYSSESVKKKKFSIGVIQEEREQEEQEDREEKQKGGFCSCLAFTSLFGGTKPKPDKILAPREPSSTEPAPTPQMVQTRHRPPPLVIAPRDR